MTFWIDAHLSPLIAAWLTWTFADVQAVALRDLGLRDAEDEEIFKAAKAAVAVVLTKDADFRHLLDQFGPPPQGSGSPAATRLTSGCKKYGAPLSPPLWSYWPPANHS